MKNYADKLRIRRKNIYESIKNRIDCRNMPCGGIGVCGGANFIFRRKPKAGA